MNMDEINKCIKGDLCDDVVVKDIVINVLKLYRREYIEYMDVIKDDIDKRGRVDEVITCIDSMIMYIRGLD